MKKILTMVMMVFIVILAGCNALTGGDQKEDLTIQILKKDVEAGITMENSEVYKGLSQLVSDMPDIGFENDFSVYIVDLIDGGTKDAAILFLGINRLKEPIKDVSFDYTFGHENGQFVFEDVEVVLTEEDAGVIQSNHAVPFMLRISAEEEALLDTLTEENQVVKTTNYSFEYAK